MRARITALYACFLLSGVAALIYEIVWQRMLTLVFGVSAWSIAAILTAYMAGLALGAWIFGRWADRIRNAARAYALVELAIALTSLAVSLFGIDPLMRVYVHLASSLEHGFYLTHLIRFALALAVFIVPCTLIGATMPFMGRLITRWCGSLGIGFGRFYAVNTCGAVVGAGLAGFALIRFIGMHAAIYVGMGANLLAGVMALVAAGATAHWTTPAPAPAEPDAEEPHPAHPMRPLLILAAIAGLTGLGYEVSWSRLLAVYTLNSVYVFTMLLTVFLAALAIGSGLAAYLLRRRPGSAAGAAAGVQIALAMTAPLVLAATRWAKELGYEYLRDSALAVFRLEYEVVFVVVFVPAVLLGMTLPLLAALLPGGAQAPGRSVAALYAWNSMGCIVGAAVTGVVLIPLAGLRATLMIFALINFAAGCYIATRWPRSPHVAPQGAPDHT
ncbi:MAG TPA: fused MFS/spermidine synthase, partial [Phycisphaerae bacterium]|nr:fused MFS/spermidine synthase [Phycisphaerae bacterium]